MIISLNFLWSFNSVGCVSFKYKNWNYNKAKNIFKFFLYQSTFSKTTKCLIVKRHFLNSTKNFYFIRYSSYHSFFSFSLKWIPSFNDTLNYFFLIHSNLEIFVLSISSTFYIFFWIIKNHMVIFLISIKIFSHCI